MDEDGQNRVTGRARGIGFAAELEMAASFARPFGIIMLDEWMHRRQTKIEALTSNKRRRHFGRTRVRITANGVWMLDWEKDSRGFGLWYETIADLWREWPELRPIACGQDDDSPWMEVVHQPIDAASEKQP
jgi:hypothetical protein